MANGNGDTLRAWWPILVVVAAGFISWGTLQTQVTALADDVEKIEKDQSEDTRQSVTERLKVRSLEERQQTIQRDVEQIKEVQKEQSKKLDAILEKLNERE